MINQPTFVLTNIDGVGGNLKIENCLMEDQKEFIQCKFAQIIQCQKVQEVTGELLISRL